MVACYARRLVCAHRLIHGCRQLRHKDSQCCFGCTPAIAVRPMDAGSLHKCMSIAVTSFAIGAAQWAVHCVPMAWPPGTSLITWDARHPVALRLQVCWKATKKRVSSCWHGRHVQRPPPGRLVFEGGRAGHGLSAGCGARVCPAPKRRPPPVLHRQKVRVSPFAEHAVHCSHHTGRVSKHK